MSPKDKPAKSKDSDSSDNELVIPHDPPAADNSTDESDILPPIEDRSEIETPKPVEPEPAMASAPPPGKPKFVPPTQDELLADAAPKKTESIDEAIDRAFNQKSDKHNSGPVNLNTSDLFPSDSTLPQQAVVYTDESYDEHALVKDKPAKFAEKKWAMISGLALVAILVLVIIISFAGRTSSNYMRKTISNSSYNYSFLFSKNATTQTSSGVLSLQGENISKTEQVVVVPKPSSISLDCITQYPQLIVAFKQNFQGKNYSVCTDLHRVAFFTYFKYNNVWQTFAIYTTGSQPLDNGTLKTILGSVQIH